VIVLCAFHLRVLLSEEPWAVRHFGGRVAEVCGAGSALGPMINSARFRPILLKNVIELPSQSVILTAQDSV
jgi:hypothetical protein